MSGLSWESELDIIGGERYYLATHSECSSVDTGIAIGAGIGGFLMLIIYLLYFLRFRRMKRWQSRTFDWKNAKGRTEIILAAFMVFLTIALILSFTMIGVTARACHVQVDIRMAASAADRLTEEALEHFRKWRKMEDSVRNIVIPACAFGMLALWAARLGTSSAFGAFHVGLPKVAKVVYYINFGIAFTMFIYGGIAIPAVLAHWRLDSTLVYDTEYGISKAAGDAMLWLYFILDFLYLATVMYVTWNVNTFLEVQNLPYPERRATSQWTLSIISIFIPLFGIISLSTQGQWTFVFIAVCTYAVETYFAMVMAVLPGFRFWIEAWKQPFGATGYVYPVQAIMMKNRAPSEQSPGVSTEAVPATQGAPSQAAPVNQSAYAQSSAV